MTKDTARLTWLQSKGSINIECTISRLGRDVYAVGDEQIDNGRHFTSLRKAIDAAIVESEKEQTK